MALYDKASLVLIPSGTKESLVFSQKPTNGDGDFTFSRSTSATRVGSSGYIEKETQNLLLQSNNFDTTWTNVGSTETSGQSGYDGSNDAWLIERVSTGGYIYQDISKTGVNTISVYAKAGSLSWMRLRVGSAPKNSRYFDLENGVIGTGGTAPVDSKIESVGNGWYRCSITTDISIDRVYFYPVPADGDISGSSGNIYIQDAQLEQGLVARDYIETTTSAVYGGITDNIPRLDYTDSSCPSLLLEPQRTNSITQSEYFGSSYWTKSSDITLTSNYGISPEGYQNADRIVANATAGGHILYRNISTTGTHTISIFAKASGYNYIFFGYDGGNLNFGIVFNLSNGTISQNPAGLNGDIEAIGSDGWYRCSLTFNYSTTGYYFVVSPHDNSGAYVWTGNGTDGILIYGAQIEYNSSYPTSYIPTYGSAVTAAKDIVSNAGNSNTFNDSEGVLFVEFSALSENRDNEFRFLISDGTNNERVQIGLQTNNNLYSSIISGNITQASFDYTLPNPTQTHKIAIKYKSNDFSFYVDGTKIDFDTSGTAPSGLDRYDFYRVANNNNYVEANVEQTLYFPTALTDEELAALTTI